MTWVKPDKCHAKTVIRSRWSDFGPPRWGASVSCCVHYQPGLLLCVYGCWSELDWWFGPSVASGWPESMFDLEVELQHILMCILKQQQATQVNLRMLRRSVPAPRREEECPHKGTAVIVPLLSHCLFSCHLPSHASSAQHRLLLLVYVRLPPTTGPGQVGFFTGSYWWSVSDCLMIQGWNAQCPN